MSDHNLRAAFVQFLRENPGEALRMARDEEKQRRRERRERREDRKCREGAEARWRWHFDHDTQDLY